MESSSDRFHDLLHSLPQELYDGIYNLTFTATPSVCNLGCVDKYQREVPADPMPHLLAVDKASRAQFAKSYYSNTTFVGYFHHTLVDWLDLLPVEHRNFLKDIRMVYFIGPPAIPAGAAHYLAWYNGFFQEQLRDAYGDGVMDIVQSGYETEVTADIPGFILSSEKIAAAQAASSSPVREALKKFDRIHKRRGVRVRFRRELNRREVLDRLIHGLDSLK